MMRPPMDVVLRLVLLLQLTPALLRDRSFVFEIVKGLFAL